MTWIILKRESRLVTRGNTYDEMFDKRYHYDIQFVNVMFCARTINDKLFILRLFILCLFFLSSYVIFSDNIVFFNDKNHLVYIV